MTHEISGRRLAVAMALFSWGMVLASIPFARAVITALRERGLLSFAAATAAIVLFLTAVICVTLLRRARRLDRRQVMVAMTLVGTVAVVSQLLPRPEDRWHAMQYLVLGMLFWVAARGTGVRRWVLALATTAVCGWLDEAVQFLVPSRVYDALDVVLNVGAGSIGVSIAGVSDRVGRRSGVS